jgi:class 3 adenylate cyclase
MTYSRQADDDLLITSATAANLHREREHWVERGSVPLKGKAENVALYACADSEGAR